MANNNDNERVKLHRIFLQYEIKAEIKINQATV